MKSWAICMALLLVTEVAAAQSPPIDAAACADAFEQGQVDRNAGELLAARGHFRTCAQDSCPAVVREQCTKFHTDVEKAMPSIVVTAKDRRGADVADVRLSIDGVPRGQRLDGKPIELDPGEHRLRLESADGKPVDQTIVIAEGERARLVRVELPIGEAPRSAVSRDEGPGLLLAGVGFGVAGAALIAGIVTGVLALGDGQTCEDGNPECTQEYIDDHQPIAHASTACFVVAGAGAVVGVVGLTLYLTGSPSESGRIGFGLRGAF